MLRGTLASLVPVLTVGVAAVMARADQPLVQVGTIALPNVEGRIDHLAVDVAGKRLYVAALGNNTVEVLDLGTGRRERSVSGFKEPQGIGVDGPPLVVEVVVGAVLASTRTAASNSHRLSFVRRRG